MWSSPTRWSARASPRTRPTAATIARPSCSRSPRRARRGWACAPSLLGTNLDDLGDHRPGLTAADERGAFAPMVDAGPDQGRGPRAVAARSGCHLGQAAARLPVVALPLRHPHHARAPAPRRRLRGRPARARLPPAARPLPRRRSRASSWRPPTCRRSWRPACGADGRAGPRHGFTFVALDLAGFASGSTEPAGGNREESVPPGKSLNSRNSNGRNCAAPGRVPRPGRPRPRPAARPRIGHLALRPPII